MGSCHHQAWLLHVPATIKACDAVAMTLVCHDVSGVGLSDDAYSCSLEQVVNKMLDDNKQLQITLFVVYLQLHSPRHDGHEN